MAINKNVDSAEPFQTRFWSNNLGLAAINAIKNREKAEAIMLFGQTYFPDFFPSKHPILHTDILALMVSDNSLKAVAVPRGHAKSTVISFLLAMYRICFQERKFIVIISESEEKAKDFVVRIREELEFNKKLRRDFAPTGKFKTTDWAKTDFVTSTNIRVSAKGAGQSLRGMIFQDTRPDMVILDDIETDETAGTEAVIVYILSNVLPAMNKRGVFDVCYVGTIIKDMAALHKVLINKEWATAKWEAIGDDDEMIAPMLLPKTEYLKSKRMYAEMGKLSVFYAEMHNNPMVADGEQTFKKEYFQYMEDLPEVPTNLKFHIFYDPAMPPSGRTKIKRVDYSVVLVLATDEHKNWYVLRIVANRDTPSKNRRLIYNMVTKYSRADNPVLVQMETIAAQRAMYLEMKEEMKKLNLKFPFREIPSHIGSKEARIELLQPLYESGRIYHNKKNCTDLEQELLMFGRTPHDDNSDTLSFAIGRVKYPRAAPQIAEKKERDFYEDFTQSNNDLSSWKTV